MSDWQPIETFDYEAEKARQGTMFVNAWVTDGDRSAPAQHWGDEDAEDGGPWYDLTDSGPGGTDKLRWAPTHFLTIPDPPKV